jgi:diguanylate cyclase (GGDEF)-like protein/PAS domain S-box-containing protein
MDLQFRFTAREARSDIVVVEIDSKSLQTLGIWPWPRGYHATVLDRLVAAGAERVGFDVDFSSRSIEEEDQEFAKALAAASGRVVLPVFRQWQESNPDQIYLTVAEPLPEFSRHAMSGSINVVPESDGLIRRYANRTGFSGRSTAGFASVLAGDPRPDLESFYIDFSTSPRSIPRISYVDVLTGQFDAAQVEDRIVIVGSTAVELGDQLAVPVLTTLPGPLVQALAFESLVQGRTLQRSHPAITLFGALAVALLMSFLFERMSWRDGLVATLGFSTATLVFAAAVQRLAPYLLDVTPWILTTAGLYGMALVTRIDQQTVKLLRERMKARRTETLMRHVVQNSFDAIITLDTDRRIRTFNRAAEFMFGFSESEACDRPLTALVVPLEPNATEDLLARAAEGPTEALGIGLDGREIPVEIVVTVIDAREDARLVAVVRDTTERRAHQEQLKHQALYDPLTDLPNRSLLLERIEQAMAVGSPKGSTVGVLVLDLDRFKEVNDALGHAVGDQLLDEFAKRLGPALDHDATLARLGGDEFSVLLPETSAERAQQSAWNLIDALKAPFRFEGLSLRVSSSVGIALFPTHGREPQVLLQRADIAMYAAKEQRSSVVVFGPEQDFDRIRQLTIRTDLGGAVDRGELHLVYQPKVLAETDRIVGVEALSRWNHPEHGFIPPEEFAAVAEHSGQIRPLTQWVLETALEQVGCWRDQGIDMRISVNLSARNLLEEDLFDRIDRLLKIYDLPPSTLTLEITESVIMDDPERSLANMQKLHDLGVGLSVDDFGTGYSSLAYLMKLPVQELKIDKSFVMRMDQDPGSATIVRFTIELAHSLGLNVVAEGVESVAIWEELKRLGCDRGQGYLFSRPVSPEALRALVRVDFCVPAAKIAPFSAPGR